MLKDDEVVITEKNIKSGLLIVRMIIQMVTCISIPFFLQISAKIFGISLKYVWLLPIKRVLIYNSFLFPNCNLNFLFTVTLYFIHLSYQIFQRMILASPPLENMHSFIFENGLVYGHVDTQLLQ